MGKINPCCCCLLRPSVKDLKTPYVRLGTTEIFSDMIQECFQLDISLGDDDECGICEECMDRLRDASNFKLQVQRSQTELRARLAGALNIKDEDPLVLSEMADEAGTCEVSILHEDAPMKLETVEVNEITVDILLKAEAVEVDGTSEEMLPPPPLEAAGSAAVPGGSVSARARQQLAMTCSVRLEEMHDGSFGVKADEEAYTCDKRSGERFERKRSLTHHVQKHETSYCCNVCSKEYSRKVFFTKHKLTHMKNKSYACKICSNEYTTKYDLAKHVAVTHVESAPFSCRTCNKLFICKSTLEIHERVHTGEKPYICDVCGKQFRQRSNLQAHLQLHTGQKPYSCGTCNKSFTQKGALERHIRMHTGEKPYSCAICNKTFPRPENLKLHIRTHTGLKPFSCEICHKAFARPDKLKRHLRIHTGL